ncbi:MAG: hypothetical protein IKV35_04275, partial [Clostridia bacterium]|nr:hypothetical protein [Clostridia bacterium]
MKRVLSLLCAICLLALALPIGTAAAETTQTKTFAQLTGYFRTLGRTVEHNSCLYMDNVASGFEIYFYGQGDVVLNATVCCTSSFEAAQYLGVYVDGNLTRVRIECETTGTHYAKAVTLASGLSEGYHHIEVYRQTEAQLSLFRAESLTYTGHMLATAPEKDLTIDVIGDSISAGYGCLWNSSLGTSAPNGNHPAYEDGMQTYAFLTGKALGADVRVTQTSGYGCVAGWNGRDVNLQTMYPLACYWRSTTFAYDFSKPADIVVINLGTNDYNTRTNNNLTNAEFQAGAKNLMQMAKNYNQGAPVVWCTGLMGTFYATEVKAAIAELGGEAAGYYFLELPKGMGGAVSHPTAAQQAAAGVVLTDFLKNNILPADYTTKATASELKSIINTARNIANPSEALRGAILRAETELTVGTTDEYRLGARLDDLKEAMTGDPVTFSLMPKQGVTKAPVAADNVSYIWPYYGNTDGSVGMYKGGDGFYWPHLATAYSQTIDVDETPYWVLDFGSTASFNATVAYRTPDGEIAYVNASTIAGIDATDFPAQTRASFTLDFAAYLRAQGHVGADGLVPIMGCDIYVIGNTDEAVRLYDCAFTNKQPEVNYPQAITGQYAVENGMLPNVAAGTAVEDLVAAMDNSELLVVKKGDQTVESGTLATGMTLNLVVDGNTVDTVTIVV